uniref:Uncharacterized protein n=1 Tax=Denticeps clupeoides TaxID=299321 RepID=A0AAY4AI03_9TELE
MASQVTNAKKRKNKAAPVKTSLNSPYEYHWSPPDRDDAHFILNKLKEKMAQLGFRKRETRDKTPRAQRSAEDQETPCRDDRTESGWTDEAARRQLAIGINEVTKGLERNELRLVLVCNSGWGGVQ